MGSIGGVGGNSNVYYPQDGDNNDPQPIINQIQSNVSDVQNQLDQLLDLLNQGTTGSPQNKKQMMLQMEELQDALVQAQGTVQTIRANLS